jgi:Uma2 family endonuclease
MPPSSQNLIGALRPSVKRPCYLASEVGITLADRDDTYYQADVAVSCTPTPAAEQHLVDPVLIVEVLSPSTASHDRTRQLLDYRRIASVQEIVLVSSQERRVEFWRRKGEKWEVEDPIGEAVLRLASIDADVPLAAIYEGVDLMPEEDGR